MSNIQRAKKSGTNECTSKRNRKKNGKHEVWGKEKENQIRRCWDIGFDKTTLPFILLISVWICQKHGQIAKEWVRDTRAKIALYNQQVIIHSPTMWEILHTYSSFFCTVRVFLVSITRTFVHVWLTTNCMYYPYYIKHTVYSWVPSFAIQFIRFHFLAFDMDMYGMDRHRHRYMYEHVCIVYTTHVSSIRYKSCFDLMLLVRKIYHNDYTGF